MPGVWVQLSQPVCSTLTALSLVGEETVVVSGQMRQMGCASIWPLALVSKEILCSPCDAEQEGLFWEQEEDGGRGANW